MDEQRFQVKNSQGNLVTIHLRRDKRLKVTSRWERMPDGSLLLRIPWRLPKRRISSLLEQVATQLDKSIRQRTYKGDAELQKRAELINQKHFEGKIRWNAIRWVGNMQSRLGSCTRGGPTDGQIRISDKIRDWPVWVVDYVIAHELLHRLHPNHTDVFWNELKTAYPLAEKAQGFIAGVSFSAGRKFEDD